MPQICTASVRNGAKMFVLDMTYNADLASKSYLEQTVLIAITEGHLIQKCPQSYLLLYTGVRSIKEGTVG